MMDVLSVEKGRCALTLWVFKVLSDVMLMLMFGCCVNIKVCEGICNYHLMR